MSRTLKFVVVLVAALALLTWIASGIVTGTTRDWAERDVALRARLAFNGSRYALTSCWGKQDWTGMQALLSDIAHDERILAAAAFRPDLTCAASTADFPAGIGVREMAAHLLPAAANPSALES